VIAVACRVRSHRGKQFRSWATRRLSEYIVKGFMLDDERLKHANEGRYFAELASRLDDIRRSSRAPWRKLLGIYATSIDYDPETPTSHSFFTAVDEKLRGGRHMADSGAENSEPFVSASLDQIATVCLEFAHLQAANGTPMYMADWAAKVVELSVKPRAG
jgi:hypothetical protein